MKKRLMGLLALALCMMVTGMPAALADYYVDGEMVWQLDLIAEDAEIESCSASGAHKIIKSASSTPGGYWLVLNDTADHEQLLLEHTGPLVPSLTFVYEDETSPAALSADDELDAYDNEFETIYMRLGFEGLNTEYFGSGGAISPAEVRAAFEEYLERNPAAGSKRAYYSVGIYQRISQNLMADAKYWAPEIMYTTPAVFPIKNASDVTVLHMRYGEIVEEQNVSVTPDGIEVVVDNYSPFLIVYNASDETANPPRTGDESQLALWFALAGLSLACMVILTVRRRRHA